MVRGIEKILETTRNCGKWSDIEAAKLLEIVLVTAMLEKNVTATAEIIQNGIYSEAQETNKEHFIISSLNTLSMSYIFDKF